MEIMFSPKSVMIVGVSNSPSNNGRVIVENMDRFGFTGAIYLVGGRTDVVAGRAVYTDVADVPEVPDIAVILIPAGRLLDVLEACGRKGIRRVVIETAGFSEFGEDRRGLENGILDAASRWGMKIIGPNCVGIVNAEKGLILPFYPLYPHEVKKGPVSVISQSGGLVHDFIVLCNIENVGVGKLVSIGNKLVCDENDFLEYLIDDPDTAVIGLYLENFRDGRRFMDLAGSTGKPIVLLKSNRNPGTKEIARFHTSALAGDDRVVDEAMKQAGVHRVGDLRAMVNAFQAFSLPPPQGPRLAVIARSGGHAVLSADSVYLHGFTLASFSERFFALLSDKTRAGVIRRTNPLDLGDVFDFGIYLNITEKALEEPGVDGVLVVHSYALGVDVEPTRRFISQCGELSRKHGKPVIFCLITHKEDLLFMKEAGGLPVFTHVDDALAAMRRSFEHARRQGRVEAAGAGEAVFGQAAAGSPRLPAGLMAVREAFDLLTRYGLSAAAGTVVKGVDEGLDAARGMGYPVALKSASPGLTHKTEAGGVILDLKDGASLKEAFGKLEADTYLVQKMAPSGCEIIIGGRGDPEFGPVIMAGIGGIFVELYKDVAIRVAPVDAEGARGMVEGLKAADILKGFRGREPYDIEYLIAALVNVSRLLTEHPEIEALDINPLILPDGGGSGVVVDAKLRVAPLGP